MTIRYRKESMEQKRLRTKPQISIRIPESLLAKLDEHVFQSDMTLTDVVCTAIADYLHARETLSLNQRVTALERKYDELDGMIIDIWKQL